MENRPKFKNFGEIAHIMGTDRLKDGNITRVPVKPRSVSWAVHTGGRLALQELHWNCSVWADA